MLPALAVLLLLSCRPKATCGDKDFYNTKDYTVFVSKQHQKVLFQMALLNEQFDKGNPREIKSQYSRLIATCDSALYIVNQLSDYNNESEFKESAVKLFSFYGEIFHNQYRKLLELYLSEDAPNESTVDSMQAIVRSVQMNEESLIKTFESEMTKLNADGQFFD
jgi:hypothetical protein